MPHISLIVAADPADRVASIHDRISLGSFTQELVATVVIALEKEEAPRKSTTIMARRDRHSHRHVRRRVEDVEYWRKRAGWFDDDKAMKDYNNGVYDAYYQAGDDDSPGSIVNFGENSEMAKTSLKVLSVVAALGLCILMLRAIIKRLGSDKKKDKKRSDSKGRSASKSRSGRSRSRSRSRRDKDGSNYELMDDDKSESKRSRSSRSKSRGRRSRSRSRARSRSKSRAVKESKPEIKEAILV